MASELIEHFSSFLLFFFLLNYSRRIQCVFFLNLWTDRVSSRLLIYQEISKNVYKDCYYDYNIINLEQYAIEQTRHNNIFYV